MSDSRSASDQTIVFHLPRKALKIAGIAFGVGVLLFVLVWLGGRKDDFYRPAPATEQKPLAEEEPLPAPLPASAGASDMPDARPDAADTAPQLVEEVPPAPVDQAAAPAGAPAALAEPGQAPPQAPNLAPGPQPVPLPGQMPSPQYPAAALRRGDQGTVVVRVEVDATGYPSAVTLIGRSGSRELDRAAMETVRRWRFRPAQQNGQATTGSIDIPFDFKPGP